MAKELLKLSVEERKEFGKGPNRRLRKAEIIPGVYYDQKGVNIPVKVKQLPLIKAYQKVEGSQVFELELTSADGKTASYPSLIWRMKYDPVKPLPIHVDFFGVDLDKELTVTVPFEIQGESAGVKLGGTLEIYRQVIDVTCKPMAIPHSLILDITDLGIGDSIQIEDVPVPDGVSISFDENYSVVGVVETIEEALDEDLEGEEGEAAESEEGEETEGEEESSDE